MPNCEKCSKGFPNHILIEGKERNLQNRKFCLECSPWKQHNTKDLNAIPIDWDSKRPCTSCKITKHLSDFYTRRDGSRPSSYCKECTNEDAIKRQRDLKKDCVEYKGGKCVLCGYNKYIGALEFHHIDSSLKDFTISNTFKTKINDVIKAELDKCHLLCSNCHREEHARLKGLL